MRRSTDVYEYELDRLDDAYAVVYEKAYDTLEEIEQDIDFLIDYLTYTEKGEPLMVRSGASPLPPNIEHNLLIILERIKNNTEIRHTIVD